MGRSGRYDSRRTSSEATGRKVDSKARRYHVCRMAALSFACVVFLAGCDGCIPRPEIDVTRDGKEVPSGSEMPFGYVTVGDSQTITFRLQNTGDPQPTAELNLTGSPMVDIQPQSTDFSTTQPPISSLSSGDAVTFSVTFKPNSTAPQAATISIKNNDDNENPYLIRVTGRGVAVGISVNPPTGLVTKEDGTNATFEVVLTSPPSANVTINLSSSDTTEGTVSPASLNFMHDNWNVPQTVTVTGVNDYDHDGDQTYSVITHSAVSTDPEYNGWDPADVSVTNRDDDIPGFVINPDPTAGLVTTEGGSTATFTVVLRSQPTANVTIGLTSSDTTEGTVSPSSLTFTSTNWNDATAHTVTVTGLDDDVIDGNMGYSIVTGVATSSDADYNGRDPDDVSVTNNDDATSSLQFASGTYTVAEGAGSVTLSVTRTVGSHGAVSVYYTTNNGSATAGSDYTATSGTLNWSSGDAQSKSISVPIINDATRENTETFTVTLSSPSGEAALGSPNPATITVTDDDQPGIIVNPTSGLVTTEGGSTATFTVVLRTQPTSTVTMGLTSSDTTEGTVSPSSLTFTTANWSNTQNVTVTGVDDDIIDGNQLYSIVTGAAVSSDGEYDGLDPDNVSVTNNDDSACSLQFSSGTADVMESTNAVTLSVTRTGGSRSAVSVYYTTNNGSATAGSDYTATSGTLNWSSGDTQSKPISIPIINDAIHENPETFTVTLSGPGGEATLGSPNPATITVTDDDVPGVVINPTNGLVTTEGGGTATFTVVLQSQPTSTVTIGLSSSDTTEGTVSPSSLTFTTTNWSNAQTVTVTGVDDNLIDGDQGFSIITAAASSTDPDYSQRNAADVSVTNNDDPACSLQFSSSNYPVNAESTGSVTIWVTRTGGNHGTVSVHYATSSGTATGGSDYTSQSGTLSWGAGDTGDKSITVPITNDGVYEGNESFTVTLSSPTGEATLGSPNPATVTIVDDPPGSLQLDRSSCSVNESDGSVTVYVTRTGGYEGPASVYYATSNGTATAGSDYTAASSTLNWSNGSAQSKPITISITNDSVAERDETFYIAISSPSPSGILGNPSQVTVTIVNDDWAIVPGSSGSGVGIARWVTGGHEDQPYSYTAFGQVDWALTTDTLIYGFVWFNLSSLPSVYTVASVRLKFDSCDFSQTSAGNGTYSMSVRSGPLADSKATWDGYSLLSSKIDSAWYDYLPTTMTASGSYSGTRWTYGSATNSAVQAKGQGWIGWKFDTGGSWHGDLPGVVKSWLAVPTVTLEVMIH